MDVQLLSKLLTLFLITQVIGLAVGIDLIQKINAGEIDQPTLVTDNPEDIENAVGLITYIIVFTAIILLVIKFAKGVLFFRIIEGLAILASAYIVFNVFFPEIALMLALLMLMIRNLLRESILVRNVSSIIAVAGTGAVVGISLGILPVMVFVALLAVYDIIAVFGTKHMVVMAKHLTKNNLAFTYALPTKKHQFELGTGDMVIPLAFSVSVLRESYALGFPEYLSAPVLICLGSIIGLAATMEYANRNIGKALPALPLQALIMIAMLAIAKALALY